MSPTSPTCRRRASRTHLHPRTSVAHLPTSFRTKISQTGYDLALHYPKSAVASISTARCTHILRKRNVVSSASKRTNGRYVFPWTSSPKRRRPRPPTNFLTCFTCCSRLLPDQVTNKLVDVALGPQTILAELVYRAVDGALRDAEGNEEVPKRP